MILGAKPRNEPVRKKKVKQPRFVDPRGEPVMVMGHSGKTRMGFRQGANGKVKYYS